MPRFPRGFRGSRRRTSVSPGLEDGRAGWLSRRPARGVFLGQQGNVRRVDDRGHRDVRGPEFGFHGRAFSGWRARAVPNPGRASARRVPADAARRQRRRPRPAIDAAPFPAPARRAWTIRHGLSTGKGPDLGAPGASGTLARGNLPLPRAGRRFPGSALPSKPRIRNASWRDHDAYRSACPTRANEARRTGDAETVKKYVAGRHSVCVERGAGGGRQFPRRRPMPRPAPCSASRPPPMTPRSCLRCRRPTRRIGAR